MTAAGPVWAAVGLFAVWFYLLLVRQMVADADVASAELASIDDWFAAMRAALPLRPAPFTVQVHTSEGWRDCSSTSLTADDVVLVDDLHLGRFTFQPELTGIAVLAGRLPFRPAQRNHRPAFDEIDAMRFAERAKRPADGSFR